MTGALSLLATTPVLAADAPRPAAAPGAGAAAAAVLAPLAANSLLLDVQSVPGAAGTLVAVGERGHVLKSADGGATWTQQPAPTRANLTAVYFADASHGWAVGHDEVILRTADGGASWTRTHFEPDREQPLMDVWFADARRGIAVGAFATVYRSDDGGVTWALAEFAPTPLVPAPPRARGAAPRAAADDEDLASMEEDDEITQPHLNAIVRSATGKLYVAGEAGHLFRSDDEGASWLALPSPYEGSFFGVLPLEGDALLAFGLRGHLFRSEDAGRSWTRLDSGTESLLSGATRLADGTIAIAGLAGTVIWSRDGGRTFTVHREADRKGFAAVAPGRDGVVLVGEAGVRTLGTDAMQR